MLLGFVGSTVWMYLFATEIIALVRVFRINIFVGMCFNIYADIRPNFKPLGKSYGLDGDCVGYFYSWYHLYNQTTVFFYARIDIVSNYIVSKQGFADMAVGACFGAPTFGIL